MPPDNKATRRRLSGAFLIAFALAITVDRLTKAWAATHLPGHGAVPIIPQILQLNYATNTGGAFGIGHEHGYVVTVLATVLSAIVLIWAIKKDVSEPVPGLWERVGMGLLSGGAVGNLIDRYSAHQVTDFLEFVFISFPVFNVADVAIDTGIALILLSSLFHPKGACKPASPGES